MFVIGITGPTGAGKTTALRVLEELGGQVVDCDAVYHELLQTSGELLGRIEAAFPGVVRDYVLDRKALGARVYADPAGLERLSEITWPFVVREVDRRLKGAETAVDTPAAGTASGGRPMAAPTDSSSVACGCRQIAGATDPPSPVACCPLPVASGGRPMTAPTDADPPSPVACCLLPVASGGRPMTAPTDADPPSPVACCLLPVASGGRPMTAPTGFAVIDAIGLFESGLADLCSLTAAVVADEEVRVRRLTARDSIPEDYARARIAAQKPSEWFAGKADLVLENNGTEAEFAEKCRREFGKRLNKKETKMPEYIYLTLRERPELKKAAAAWFHDKWGVPEEAYLECMEAYLKGETELGWYLCLEDDKNTGENTGDGSLCSGTQRTVPCVLETVPCVPRIVGGLGVIENDFHDRKDLSPNVCAVFTEPEHRGRGIAGRLLDLAVEDLRSKGISPVYLVTDHTGFYERYGWEFFCMAQGDGEEEPTRLYIHR